MVRKSKKARGRRGFAAWIRAQFGANPKPLWLVITSHALALGVALVLYALPHHVIPRAEASIDLVSIRASRPVTTGARGDEADEPFLDIDVEPEDTELYDESGTAFGDDGASAPAGDAESPQDSTEVPADGAAAAPTEEDVLGSFRNKFADHFTDGEVESTKSSYRSGNIDVTLKKRFIRELQAKTYVADIYIADISCLTTAFGKDTYGKGYREWITKIAKRKKSVVTINGDYYGCHNTGPVIRNGTLYRDKKTRDDIAVLYWDGSFRTFSPDGFNAREEIINGAYQSWCFGPSLLDEDGKALKQFNCIANVAKSNPRTAIGYYEPGHYCFVTVDGRNDESKGASMERLAILMQNLGCKAAYNLDGGQTSLMAIGSRMVNKPSDGGRSSSDYIMIVDKVSE